MQLDRASQFRWMFQRTLASNYTGNVYGAASRRKLHPIHLNGLDRRSLGSASRSSPPHCADVGARAPRPKTKLIQSTACAVECIRASLYPILQRSLRFTSERKSGISTNLLCWRWGRTNDIRNFRRITPSSFVCKCRLLLLDMTSFVVHFRSFHAISL